MLTMSIASANRITEILVETPSITNPENPVMEVKSGEIQFDNVHFSYAHGAEEEILTGIDLTIHDGETIGIIGGTGCGKSSFVCLPDKSVNNQFFMIVCVLLILTHSLNL